MEVTFQMFGLCLMFVAATKKVFLTNCRLCDLHRDGNIQEVAYLNLSWQVIVTEQEIDEEIVKETKDKAEDYRKLKYYQVASYFSNFTVFLY